MSGLERLLATCEKYPVRAHIRKPWGGAPSAGTLLLGRAMDPMLAAFYSRLGGLRLDRDLYVNACDEQVNGILLANEQVQPYWPEPFRSLLLFGGKEASAYTFATVPSLADAQGLQPVVEVNPYEDFYALPIASNVDRFFDTYARYMELIYQTPELSEERGAWPVFPWEVPELIAADRALMGMLVEGRFDFLMFQEGVEARRVNEEIREWIAQLRAVST
ncbi:hypothetical protein [Archangium sp.]|uniref:hypothetical protein n=1 Tax=Archangium sp. TaxID=1872627 RepID=UPI002D5B879D|nr:hypothetical protein [Archangium sp.]HYO58913.1 hypothetical protein [Archangium sp.]